MINPYPSQISSHYSYLINGIYDNFLKIRAITGLISEKLFIRQVKELSKEELAGIKDAENILSKGLKQPSIEASSDELFTLKDYEDLERLYKKFPLNPTISKAYRLIQHAIQEDSKKLDLILKNTQTTNTTENIIAAKYAVANITLEVCLHVEFSLLKAHMSAENIKKLESITALSQIHGEDIDIAFLDDCIQQYEKANHHPHVVIEGGGPTGLLCAITQFISGADVTVFEKRSMQYNRSQITKLDRKWVALLRLYLGEKFIDLFESPNKKGVLRANGTVDLALKDLEDALHLLLTKLISRLEQKKGLSPPIERFAAHECSNVFFEDGQFLIEASYKPDQDPSIEKLITPNKKIKNVDMLICAGGKNSSLKEDFLPSTVAINEKDYYGVSSWLADDLFPSQDPEKMNFFSDFRNTFLIDEAVITAFNTDLRKVTTDQLATIEKNLVHTRTFENRGLIYIGMQIPKEVYSILEKLPPEDRKLIEQKWFQRVLHSYGPSLQSIPIDAIDKPFCATFPLEQHLLAKDHTYSLLKAADKKLLIVAAGDAFATPHFMRYSGLGGAREIVSLYQKYTRSINNDENYTTEDLKQEMDRIAEFISSKGRVFLKDKKSTDIEQLRIEKMEKHLDSITKKGLLTKQGNLYYVVGSNNILSPKAGWIENTITGKKYESFLQFQFDTSKKEAVHLILR
jgi:hypothetical protein